MTYSTIFSSIYTNSVCSLMKNTEILILLESKKSKYYLGTQMVKQNDSEYNQSAKIYNGLFYSVLEYIHQLHMLSHLKYRNSIFKRIEKKSKYYLGTPMLKVKWL